VTRRTTAARIRRPLPALAALALLAVAGCGTATAGTDAGGGPPSPDPVATDKPATGEEETPSATPAACPESGLALTLDAEDTAMGLRVLGLRLTNCSGAPVEIEGYPEVFLLDAEGRPYGADAVEVVHGSGGISSGTDFDDPPQPVALDPGEWARGAVMWRNTTEFGEPVNAAYLEIAPLPGEDTQRLTPEAPLDLGTTGLLGVRPWTAANS
jgi:hypothetical protein